MKKKGTSTKKEVKRTVKKKVKKAVKKTVKKTKLKAPAKPKVVKEGPKLRFTVTAAYLSGWNKMFSLYKKHIKETQNLTVPRTHPNRAFHRWFQMQKFFYSHSEIDEIYPKKQEHIKKLQEVGFYFGDGHDLEQKKRDEEWLTLLAMALKKPKEKEKIQVSHRYKFKGKGLGTWLVSIHQATKQQNPKPHKLEVKQRIEQMGFSFLKVSRDPYDTAKRFLDNLMLDPNPVKVAYQNNFNKVIIGKKKILPSELKRAIDMAWKYKFNEQRSWDGPQSPKAKVKEWKSMRYDKALNPSGKWYAGQKVYGKLYYWIYAQHRKQNRLDEYARFFNETEKQELRNEGFQI